MESFQSQPLSHGFPKETVRTKNPQRSVQRSGDFVAAVPLAAQIKYACDHWSSHRIDDKNVRVLRVFQAAGRSVTANVFPGLGAGLLDGSDLVTVSRAYRLFAAFFGIASISLMLVDGIHAIVKGGKPAEKLNFLILLTVLARGTLEFFQSGHSAEGRSIRWDWRTAG